MGNLKFDIDDTCVKCGACAEDCPVQCITEGTTKFIAIQSALLEPYKCISYLKIVQACSNLKWVSVIGRLKKEQACTNLKRARVIGLLKIEQACSNLKWARVIGHLKK